MGKKTIKGYLVGYDSDEDYRNWLKKWLFFPKDVIFHEKLKKCDNSIHLPFNDSKQKNTNDLSNQGKYEEEQFQDEKQNDPRHSNVDSDEVKPLHDMQLIKRDEITKTCTVWWLYNWHWITEN